MEADKIRKIQETILDILPYWNYKIIKPFKQLLEEGVSMEVYSCLRVLQASNGIMTMTELAVWMKMTKQQMTKLSNRLVELELVKRVFDPADRRIIKLEITDNARNYIDSFLNCNADYFREMLDCINEKECIEFQTALDSVLKILMKMSYEQPK